MNIEYPDQRVGASVMHGGFANSVLDSQTVFRSIMDGMAQPGSVRDLEAMVTPPAPIFATTAAILASLADADTPVWLDAELSKSESVKDWLTFHVSPPFADECSEAAFAVIANPSAMQDLEFFAMGDQDYPDRSTTLIIQVEELSGDQGWQLSGPGIKDKAYLTAGPMKPSFPVEWAANNQKFPRGVDAIFASPNSIACLPRTTRLLPLNDNGEV